MILAGKLYAVIALVFITTLYSAQSSSTILSEFNDPQEEFDKLAGLISDSENLDDTKKIFNRLTQLSTKIKPTDNSHHNHVQIILASAHGILNHEINQKIIADSVRLQEFEELFDIIISTFLIDQMTNKSLTQVKAQETFGQLKRLAQVLIRQSHSNAEAVSYISVNLAILESLLKSLRLPT